MWETLKPVGNYVGQGGFPGTPLVCCRGSVGMTLNTCLGQTYTESVPFLMPGEQGLGNLLFLCLQPKLKKGTASGCKKSECRGCVGKGTLLTFLSLSESKLASKSTLESSCVNTHKENMPGFPSPRVSQLSGVQELDGSNFSSSLVAENT